MPKIEIDGKTIEAAAGTTVIDCAHRLGIYIPHFCYHKKLSIAANCRMCLVQVEKAPKPMPACATPITDGMKVWTHSEQAVQAQKSVMEFLLINHPLDCPICDQGGECQLQDLAVGYGPSESRYKEVKRVVFRKELGPLVAAEEMTRCIQCTRCVRFGQEVAGYMELGLIGRGEHAEIVSFVGRTVESELSGNMIDLCPVGALTSEPFRYKARTWELTRRKSISPHDSLGSNLIVQVMKDRVMRVLPLDNETVNECWLSDKDRFSYLGLGSPERLTEPMIKQNGEWITADWKTALEFTAHALRDITEKHGANALGTLVSPHSTLEEMALAAKLVRDLGSDNIDFRLRQTDFRGDGMNAGIPWLGMPIAEINSLERVLVVGSFLRKDHPLIAHRLRQAAKKGAQISLLHSVADQHLIKIANTFVAPPSMLPRSLAEIVVASAKRADKPVPDALTGITPSPQAEAIALSLWTGERKAIFLGNFAEQHPDASQLFALAQALAEITGARLGFLTEAANSVGGYVAKAMPQAGGLNAQSMLNDPRPAYVLMHAEPQFDCANPVAARAALERAEFVAVMSPFRHGMEYASVLLPIAPFTETTGSFISCEGRVQRFNGVVRPLGDTRPAWKVLRVLGSLLGLTGFEFETIDEARAASGVPDSDIALRLGNRTRVVIAPPAVAANGLERVADVPIYFADALVRRAPPLQQTPDAAPPRARMNREMLQQLGLNEGAQIRIRQGRGEAVLTAAIDATVPSGVVRIAAAHPSTAALEGLSGPIAIEKT